MGKHLDLDDVAHGHPVAERELSDLRARAEAAEAEAKNARRNALANLTAHDAMKARAEAAEAEVERLRGERHMLAELLAVEKGGDDS